MDNIKIIWDLFCWGFGVCATGFFFLAGWIRYVSGRVSEQAKQLSDQEELKKILCEIRDSLVGDLKNRGLITKVSFIQDEIRDMKLACKLNHEGDGRICRGGEFRKPQGDSEEDPGT